MHSIIRSAEKDTARHSADVLKCADSFETTVLKAKRASFSTACGIFILHFFPNGDYDFEGLQGIWGRKEKTAGWVVGGGRAGWRQ